MSPVELLLAIPAARDRAAAAVAFARALGGEEAVVLVRDPEAGALVPAPGFPPTLRGAESWRELVRRCAEPGRHAAEVELPVGRRRHAEALACENLAFVMLAATPQPGALAKLAPMLPLLAFAFGAEQRAQVAEAAAAEARRAAERANALARALDAARAEATQLNAELRAEHARKDDFLAMLAHELRNPLSPLVTSLDLLRLAAPGDPRMAERLEVMSRQVRQLSQLVDDLLDVSRVSRGRIELRREALSLGDLVRDALDSIKPMLDARRHRLELELAPGDALVHGDRLRLTQVLVNLLHNAAKYTDPGGVIRITTSADAAWARVEVADNGVGIDAATLPHVFTLFSQAPVSLARSQGGLGIGLTLVRTLVTLHGGHVEARSEGRDKGSAFAFTLPRVAGPPEPAAQADSPAAPRARALRFLIVDDNVDAADALGSLVTLLGHHAQVVYSSAGALSAAADSEADVALLDIGLPDMDGYQLAGRLRRLLRPQAYLVALTGYGGEEHVRRAREAGFDEHLVKPASVSAIEALAARV